MKKIDVIIRSLINSFDPDSESYQILKSDDHDQINDHDHNLSDDELLSWFRSWLANNGVDPDHREYSPKTLKSVKYFATKLDEISNPLKYVSSFLPPQVKPSDVQGTNVLGFTQEQISAWKDKVNAKLYRKALDLSPSLRAKDLSYSAAANNESLMSFITATLLKAGVFDPDLK